MDTVLRNSTYCRHAYRHRCWRQLVAFLLIITISGLIFTPAGWAQSEGARANDTDSTGNPSGAALQAASWLVTLPYGALKVGFALAGGVVGSLTYLLSAGDVEAAKSVWRTTMYGTYVLTPEHLKGQKPIRFLGVPDRVSDSQAIKER